MHSPLACASAFIIGGASAQFTFMGVTFGGPASTVTVGGVEPYTLYSATVPAPTEGPAYNGYGAISTAYSTETEGYPGQTTTYTEVRSPFNTGTFSQIGSTSTLTLWNYYTTIGGSTYYPNDFVPLSVWAPGPYPCPKDFINNGYGQCYFCPGYAGRSGCMVQVFQPQCPNGYFTTDGAANSYCVTTAPFTPTTTYTSATDDCPNGYSTYTDGACVLGTNVEGPNAGPPRVTLGGPAATITTAGFTLTEYSAALPSGGIEELHTLTGTPTTTFTVGGGSTTFEYQTRIPTGLSTYDISRVETLVSIATLLTTESLGYYTVTEYNTLVVPVPYAVLPDAIASASNATTTTTGAAGAGISSSTSASSSQLSGVAGAGQSSSGASSSSVAGVTSPSASPGSSSGSMITSTSASAADASSTSTSSSTVAPYKGDASRVTMDVLGSGVLGAVAVVALALL